MLRVDDFARTPPLRSVGRVCVDRIVVIRSSRALIIDSKNTQDRTAATVRQLVSLNKTVNIVTKKTVIASFVERH